MRRESTLKRLNDMITRVYSTAQLSIVVKGYGDIGFKNLQKTDMAIDFVPYPLDSGSLVQYGQNLKGEKEKG